MNFYYLHQIKHETCLHEEGMNIKRHLRKKNTHTRTHTYKHTHTYIHTRAQTPTQTPTENMPTFCENLDHYISHVHFIASIRLLILFILYKQNCVVYERERAKAEASTEIIDAD